MATRTTDDFFREIPDKSVKSLAESILKTLSFPADIAGLNETLEQLQKLLPYLSVIDPGHRTEWEEWRRSIPGLISIASKIELATQAINSKTSVQKDNRWYGKFNTLPLLGCLAQNTPDPDLEKRLIPAKAILLATYRYGIDEGEDPEKLGELCDRVRRGHKPSSPEVDVLKIIPPMEGHTDLDWANKFKARYAELQRPHYLQKKSFGSLIPDVFSPVRRLHRLLRKIEDRSDNVDLGNQSVKEIIQAIPLEREFDTRQTTSSLHRPASRRSRRIHLYRRVPNSDEIVADALEPERQQAITQADTPADEPSLSVPSQALEIRYTNYRTALDNQRLPYAWDRLNSIEIAILVEAIKNAGDVKEPDVQVAAFLTWLMLLTGQYLPSMLQLKLGPMHQPHDCLLEEGIWRHYMPSPPHAYSPSPKQMKWLSNHADFVDLQFPKPWPDLMTSIFSNQVSSSGAYVALGDALSLSESDGEKLLRNFLGTLRGRQARLLPGRIRQVLANELMQTTGDKVLTYFIAGLPTEMPPAGVYYTSYQVHVVQRAYADAAARISKNRNA